MAIHYETNIWEPVLLFPINVYIYIHTLSKPGSLRNSVASVVQRLASRGGSIDFGSESPRCFAAYRGLYGVILPNYIRTTISHYKIPINQSVYIMECQPRVLLPLLKLHDTNWGCHNDSTRPASC